MKIKILLLALVAGLTTMGSSCLNDNFLISVNLQPIRGCYAVQIGSNPSFNDSTFVNPDSLLDSSYRDKIKNARVYDIRVYVLGTFSGSVAGAALIDGVPVLTFSGNWADFSTPQSLLGRSPNIIPQQSGIARLIAVLQMQPLPVVKLSANGQLTGTASTSLTLCVELYAQVDAEV